MKNFLFYRVHKQGFSHEMIKGSPNLLIVGPGWGLWSFHNAIWWNLAIFFYVQAENRPTKDGWTGLRPSPFPQVKLLK